MNAIKAYFEQLIDQFKSISFGVTDFFDILLVSILLYYVYKFIRDRRAGKLAVGVFIIVLISVLSNLFGLSALSFLINNFFQIGLLALVVIFQPELRAALEKAGGNSLRGLRALGLRDSQSVEQLVDAICDAACELSKDKTGALIVFENETKLGDIIASGTIVNADVSAYLLRNIFFVNTPLHDGAVVIRSGRVYAAGCFLPLSENQEIDKQLGTRHRAAIGMTEVSDALVLVVSEESGVISLVSGGKIKRNYTYASLRKALISFYSAEEETTKRRFRLFKKNGKNHNAAGKDPFVYDDSENMAEGEDNK